MHVRGSGYNFADFTLQFAAVRQALPQVPIAGPALGGRGLAGQTTSSARFIAAQPGLSLVTVHTLSAPAAAPRSSLRLGHPTIAHSCSAMFSTSGLAQGVEPLVAGARARSPRAAC